MRLRKIRGLAEGGVGRKNSAQLFLFFHLFANSFGISAPGNGHSGNLLRDPNFGHVRVVFSKFEAGLMPAVVHGLGCGSFATPIKIPNNG